MTPGYRPIRGALRLLAPLLLFQPLAVPAEVTLGQGQAMQSAKFIRVNPEKRSQPEFAPGQVFPVYDHSMVIDTMRHHLPPVDGHWRYYELGAFVYRVDAGDAHVLSVEPRRR